MPWVKAHAPTKPAVRMHHENQPLDVPGVNWTRPWSQHMLSMHRFAKVDLSSR